jgi:putative hydrolase of HD superfamily
MGKNVVTQKKIPELRFARVAPDVWSALHELKRTGWVKRGVVNPESVQEHTIALRTIAFFMEGLSEKEKEGLLDMLEVHDWPEALHGDEVIVSTDEHELQRRKAVKFEKEQKALTLMCEGLGDVGKEIMNLWLRFETSLDDAARFAKQLDKYQAIEKALAYEKAQGIPLFKEFLDYSRKSITHPLLVERIKKLEQEFENK